jgi:uncharacterized protein (TIGR03083 family)
VAVRLGLPVRHRAGRHGACPYENLGKCSGRRTKLCESADVRRGSGDLARAACTRLSTGAPHTLKYASKKVGRAIEKHEYLACLQADVYALATAARCGLTASVPSCPGWSVADLVVHTGGVHRTQANIVATRAQEPTEPDWQMFRSVPGLLQWLENSALTGGTSDLAAVPPGLFDWFEEGAAILIETLAAADPDETVWSWSAHKRVAHYLRMMPIETVIHRWDAQLAHGRTEPVDQALAVDGIDHTFEVMMPFRRAQVDAPPGHGERYRFLQTDGSGVWIVRFDGEPQLTRDDEDSVDVTVKGTASDLFLFLWQRRAPADLAVEGDSDLLRRYFVLVPPR